MYHVSTMTPLPRQITYLHKVIDQQSRAPNTYHNKPIKHVLEYSLVICVLTGRYEYLPHKTNLKYDFSLVGFDACPFPRSVHRDDMGLSAHLPELLEVGDPLLREGALKYLEMGYK